MGAAKKFYTDIVFDGPPGPEAGRFVEVEDVIVTTDIGAIAKSVSFGEWIERRDAPGFWALRIPGSPTTLSAAEELLVVLERMASLGHDHQSDAGPDCEHCAAETQASAIIAKARGRS